MLTFLTALTMVMVTTLAMVLVNAEPQAAPIRPARPGVRISSDKVVIHGSDES